LYRLDERLRSDVFCFNSIPAEESWVREWEVSEACLFIPKGSLHLLLLTTIVLTTTRRDLVVATEREPGLVRPYTAYDPCGSTVKAEGCSVPGHRTGGEQRPDFRSTVIEVGLVEEGESGLRCGKTVRCVRGAYCLTYCLAYCCVKHAHVSQTLLA
jgi:hypothetical protein